MVFTLFRINQVLFGNAGRNAGIFDSAALFPKGSRRGRVQALPAAHGMPL
jgi:hypothetical protein